MRKIIEYTLISVDGVFTGGRKCYIEVRCSKSFSKGIVKLTYELRY